MTLDQINLLLTTAGPVVVVAGVAGIANLLVRRQTPRVGQQIREGEADVRAAEQEWLDTHRPEPAKASA